MSESLGSSDKMEEPDHYDPDEDIKTKFVTVTPEEKKAFKYRRLSTKFGGHVFQFKWLDLTSDTKVEAGPHPPYGAT